MDKIIVKGGRPLQGEVTVSGAKNAALPILASALLADGKSVYRNVPDLADVTTMLKVLGTMGCETARLEGRKKDVCEIAIEGPITPEAPYDLVKTMRASVLVLGPLVARFGRARVSMPGGCAIGARPIDQHLKGLKALGADITLTEGYVEARAKQLKGGTVNFDVITVTGTENVMMAAVLAKGRTVLENCAREPEIEELARVLNKMGARIEGAGTSVITIDGVDALKPVEHAILPDRIEAGTLMVAAAITGGNVLVKHAVPEHLEAVILKLRETGCTVTSEDGGLRGEGAQGHQLGGREDDRAPGLPHGHAGPAHGADDGGLRHLGHLGEHLREPLHARAGAAPDGRGHHHPGPHGRGEGRQEAVRGAGDGHGPARQRLPRPGGPARRGEDRGRTASTTWTGATSAWSASCASWGRTSAG